MEECYGQHGRFCVECAALLRNRSCGCKPSAFCEKHREDAIQRNKKEGK